jgi:signal transduction histidine kinase/ActR/RegA family two-component response regulator
MRFGSFVDECSWEAFSEQLAASQRGERTGCELWLKPWNRSSFCARMNAVRAPHRESEFLVLLTDLSDHQRERSELESTNRRLEARLRELEPRGVMAAGIAHDFNNLLASVIINADAMLAARDVPESLRRPLSLIARTAGDAVGLSRQLLAPGQEHAAADGGVDLSQVVAGCVELMRTRAGKSVEIQTQLPAELPEIAAERLQVQRVVMNILTNAIEAMGDRGIIVVSAHVERLEAQALESFEHAFGARPGRFAILHIADTGPGMDAEEASGIFERFVTTKSAGRGLGLSIVRDIITACGGAIHLLSQPGQGTSFEIAFPLVHSAPQPEPSIEQPEPQPIAASVLLIDDDQLLSSAVARALRSSGLEVTVAEDGRRGVATFVTAERAFDVVVLDWLLPGWSGEQVMLELRRVRPDLPIVLLSGFGMEAIDDELVICMMKPASINDLRLAIRRAIAAGQRRSQIMALGGSRVNVR